MKRLFLLTLMITALISLSGCNQPEPEVVKEQLPVPVTPEEKAVAKEAHSLGTRLYATAIRAEETLPTKEERQIKLQPIYGQIEEFIFRRLAAHTNRITSITVTYNAPGIQCMIYVRSGTEDELVELKKSANSCVGRIIENLPMVKYLMVKNENE